MAITRADYELFRRIRESGLSRPGSSLLEIGEAEFYGDVPAQHLLRDIKAHGTQGAFLEAANLIGRIRRGGGTEAAWGLSKVIYEVFLGCEEFDSIDLHGSEDAEKMDLNHAVSACGQEYDVVYNCGTAEHVWRISRVLEFMHDATKTGGLMVHCFPFTGLIDHGFWTVNPVLVFCLARANDYEILLMCVSQIEGKLVWLDPATARKDLREMARAGTLPDNSWLHVAFRKASDAAFVIPCQEIYTACPDPEVVEAWREMR